MSAAACNGTKSGNSDNSSRSRTPMSRFVGAEALSLMLDTYRQEFQELTQQNARLLGTQSMLTERVASLELALAQANEFAHYDELTKLPNRRLLLDRFKQASTLANRHDHSVALLFFDLNEFKWHGNLPAGRAKAH